MSARRAGAPPSDLLGEVLVAQQPILDRHLMVVGQELLYRDVGGNAPVSHDEGVRATATILLDLPAIGSPSRAPCLTILASAWRKRSTPRRSRSRLCSTG